jgi:hypothetical protein
MSRTARAIDPLSPRSFALWFGVLGPPVAWGANLVLGDLIFELGCSPGLRGPGILGLSLEAWSLIQTVALAAVTVVAGVFAYRAWRELGRISNGTAWGRAHAMAIAGLASAAIYLALIVYGFMAPFFLDRCGTSL